MIYTEGFLDDAAAIWSERVKRSLVQALAALESFPEIGSTDVADSIRERYGSEVRKMTVGSFSLVYEYDRTADEVWVYGLVPMRRAR